MVEVFISHFMWNKRLLEGHEPHTQLWLSRQLWFTDGLENWHWAVMTWTHHQPKWNLSQTWRSPCLPVFWVIVLEFQVWFHRFIGNNSGIPYLHDRMQCTHNSFKSYKKKIDEVFLALFLTQFSVNYNMIDTWCKTYQRHCWTLYPKSKQSIFSLLSLIL